MSPTGSEGVGSNWTGFLGMAEVKALLNIPAQMEVLAVVPFGYPVQSKTKG